MEKAPFISVVVPTFNRAELLARALRSIFENPLDGAEVLVGDNASTDDTPRVAGSFSAPSFRYFRNESDIGPVRNIVRLIEKANGRYVLFLTDDDLFEENALRGICGALSGNAHIGMLCSALRIMDGESDRVVNEKTPYPADRLFKAGEDALTGLFPLTNVLSGMAIRRDLIDAKGALRYEKSLYPQMFMAGSALKKSCGFYISSPAVRHRVNNKTYWEYEEDFMAADIVRMIKELTEGEPYGKRARERLIGRRVSDSLYSLLSARRRSFSFFLRHARALKRIPEYGRSARFWANVLAAALAGAPPAGHLRGRLLRQRGRRKGA